MPEHDSSVPIVASKGLECTCELRESESSLLHADCMGGIRILNPDCPIHGKAKSDSDVNEASGSAVEQRAIRCVVHITREYGSLAGVGGIKDVAEGLCRATASRGIVTHVFLPYYKSSDLKGLSPRLSLSVPMPYTQDKQRTETVFVFCFADRANLTVHMLKSDRYDYIEDGKTERRGIYVYTPKEAAALGAPQLTGKGYIDFFAMNVLLVKAALLAMPQMGIIPDVVHCHDGHAALFPLIAQASNNADPLLAYAATVVTVHNAGMGFHQEVDDLSFAETICEVSPGVINGCLLNNRFDPLVAGGLFGSCINTVSENYARELIETGQDATTGWLGHRLAGYGIELLGITNGIDIEADTPKLDQLEVF